jgi:hypothetical protein
MIRLKLRDSLSFLAPVISDDLIRMGKDADGGYILTERSMMESDSLLSLGINHDWSFDQEWAIKKPNDKIHGYDGTISPSRMNEGLRKNYREFFGNNAVHFPVNVGPESNIGFTSFNDAMIRINSSNVFLKMDIENGEWSIMSQILEHSDKITGMVIEFHSTDQLSQLFVDTIKKLQEHFHIVHLHPNTSCRIGEDNFPTVVEISFANKKLSEYKGTRKEIYLPHLDQPNILNTPDIALYFE